MPCHFDWVNVICLQAAASMTWFSVAVCCAALAVAIAVHPGNPWLSVVWIIPMALSASLLWHTNRDTAITLVLVAVSCFLAYKIAEPPVPHIDCEDDTKIVECPLTASGQVDLAAVSRSMSQLLLSTNGGTLSLALAAQRLQTAREDGHLSELEMLYRRIKNAERARAQVCGFIRAATHMMACDPGEQSHVSTLANLNGRKREIDNEIRELNGKIMARPNHEHLFVTWRERFLSVVTGLLDAAGIRLPAGA